MPARNIVFKDKEIKRFFFFADTFCVDAVLASIGKSVNFVISSNCPDPERKIFCINTESFMCLKKNLYFLTHTDFMPSRHRKHLKWSKTGMHNLFKIKGQKKKRDEVEGQSSA